MPYTATMVRQSLNRCTARSTGIAVVVIAVFSACSSPPDKKEQDKTRASQRAASLALQARANDDARLARKAQAKDDALLFVRLAQNGCQELARRIEALSTDSTVDVSKMNSFIPPELYPTAPFVAYVNERALVEVKSQLTQLMGSVVELLRTVERSQAATTAHVERQSDDVIKYRAVIQEQKLKTLAISDAYCESVQRAGAGVDMIR